MSLITTVELFKEINELKDRIFDLEKTLKQEKDTIDSIEVPIEYIDKETPDKIGYEHIGDAGFDFKSDNDYLIKPGEIVLIKTGIKMAIPEGYELQIRARSGISLKTYLRVANGVGTIDSGYRGEIGIIFHNTYYDYKEYTRNNSDSESFTFLDLKGNPVMIDNIADKSYPNNTYYIRKGDRIAQGILAKISVAKFNEVKDVSMIGKDRGGGFGSTSI